MTKQQFISVCDLLELKGETLLADSLDTLPHNQIAAIADMAMDLKERQQAPSEIAARVVHDVAGFMENEADFKPYCKAWLNAPSINPFQSC